MTLFHGFRLIHVIHWVYGDYLTHWIQWIPWTVWGVSRPSHREFPPSQAVFSLPVSPLSPTASRPRPSAPVSPVSPIFRIVGPPIRALSATLAPTTANFATSRITAATAYEWGTSGVSRASESSTGEWATRLRCVWARQSAD